MFYSNPNALHFKIRPKDIDSGVVQSPVVKQARFKVSPDVIYVRQIAYIFSLLSVWKSYQKREVITRSPSALVDVGDSV